MLQVSDKHFTDKLQIAGLFAYGVHLSYNKQLHGKDIFFGCRWQRDVGYSKFHGRPGHIVVGSDRLFDRNPNNSLCEILKAGGVTIVRQDGSGINNSFDFAVFSTAVEDGQSEVIRARELGISVKTRPRYLCEIVAEFRTVAVTGTSGKSTTAGMLAFLMDKLGLRPNFIGGKGKTIQGKG